MDKGVGIMNRYFIQHFENPDLLLIISYSFPTIYLNAWTKPDFGFASYIALLSCLFLIWWLYASYKQHGWRYTLAKFAYMLVALIPTGLIASLAHVLDFIWPVATFAVVVVLDLVVYFVMLKIFHLHQ